MKAPMHKFNMMQKMGKSLRNGKKLMDTMGLTRKDFKKK